MSAMHDKHETEITKRTHKRGTTLDRSVKKAFNFILAYFKIRYDKISFVLRPQDIYKVSEHEYETINVL